MRRLSVLGAGGHAKVVVSTARAAGLEVAEVWDDDPRRWGGELHGVPVRGPIAELPDREETLAVIAIGANAARRRVADSLKEVTWATLIHPFTWVDPAAELGAGTVIFAGAVVQPDVRAGHHVIVNTAASIDHDCMLEDFVHVACGAHLAGGVTVGSGTLLGAGSSVMPGIRVGRWSILGAGGTAVRDLTDGCVAVGVPARPRRSHERE